MKRVKTYLSSMSLLPALMTWQDESAKWVYTHWKSMIMAASTAKLPAAAATNADG
jgi:hypothetical protein